MNNQDSIVITLDEMQREAQLFQSVYPDLIGEIARVESARGKLNDFQLMMAVSYAKNGLGVLSYERRQTINAISSRVSSLFIRKRGHRIELCRNLSSNRERPLLPCEVMPTTESAQKHRRSRGANADRQKLVTGCGRPILPLISLAVLRRRAAEMPLEHADEVTGSVETDIECDVGHFFVCIHQEDRRLLDANLIDVVNGASRRDFFEKSAEVRFAHRHQPCQDG